MASARRVRRVRCLVVEDDPFSAELAGENLELGGYEATVVGEGRKALEILLADPPDICVLDIDLPGIDGLSILQRLRAERSEVGIIMLTGRSADLDRVRGLRMGADDYLGKPFLPAELVARVDALARRMQIQVDEIIEGDLRLNLAARATTWKDVVIDLTKTEFDLLAELASSPSRVVTRQQLLTRVWNLPPEWKADATLTEHVHRVRSKLPDISIVTVRGVGYRFDP